ncbi:MAG: aspartyl protease family protein [Candidatus Hydrogenedentota bacterium]
MGITYLVVSVSNPKKSKLEKRVRCLVDSSATYSMIDKKILTKIGIRPDDEIILSLAHGSEVKRMIGEVAFTIAGKRRDSTVIFGEPGDTNLLGAVTLKIMGLFLDPLKRKLKPLKIIAATSDCRKIMKCQGFNNFNNSMSETIYEAR